ncbi:hypothetical protein ONE63_010608 [Megalurothrips usitatus]|uniref:Uncharacterized protein n=1 Tax=Megalurothrips usitatus TaxID=439358 RepID=A0AAV7XHM3_9NEOP|nr:hypothetical protein ONE63_010608 [Megalurothrips usitatus]
MVLHADNEGPAGRVARRRPRPLPPLLVAVLLLNAASAVPWMPDDVGQGPWADPHLQQQSPWSRPAGYGGYSGGYSGGYGSYGGPGAPGEIWPPQPDPQPEPYAWNYPGSPRQGWDAVSAAYPHSWDGGPGHAPGHTPGHTPEHHYFPAPQHWSDDVRAPAWDQRPYPRPHQRETPDFWDSWEEPPYNAGARWARSSVTRAARNRRPDTGAAKAAVVILDGGVRVPARMYRLILAHYLVGGWREATTAAGARIVSANFDEFERSARKFPVEVRLSPHVAVPALAYCLVVRSALEPRTNAVLEEADGRTCPLHLLAERPEFSQWCGSLFPGGLGPRARSSQRPTSHRVPLAVASKPHVWSPPAGTPAGPPATPRVWAPPTPTSPPVTTATSASASAGKPGSPQESKAAAQPASSGGRHHRHHEPAGPRLPAIWSPSGLPRPAQDAANSIAHVQADDR